MSKVHKIKIKPTIELGANLIFVFSTVRCSNHPGRHPTQSIIYPSVDIVGHLSGSIFICASLMLEVVIYCKCKLHRQLPFSCASFLEIFVFGFNRPNPLFKDYVFNDRGLKEFKTLHQKCTNISYEVVSKLCVWF